MGKAVNLENTFWSVTCLDEINHHHLLVAHAHTYLRVISCFGNQINPCCYTFLQNVFLFYLHFVLREQSGAVEACWAHNPEVRRSKLRSATIIFLKSPQLPF